MRHTSIRHPSANPTEMYIRYIIKYLRILISEENHEWQVEEFMSNTLNRIIGKAPISSMKGIEPNK